MPSLKVSSFTMDERLSLYRRRSPRAYDVLTARLTQSGEVSTVIPGLSNQASVGIKVSPWGKKGLIFSFPVANDQRVFDLGSRGISIRNLRLIVKESKIDRDRFVARAKPTEALEIAGNQFQHEMSRNGNFELNPPAAQSLVQLLATQLNFG